MTHNRIKDQIAIVGIGSTGYSRTGTRTARALAAEAAVAAIRDAGVTREEIGAVVSSAGMGSYVIMPPGAAEMTATLRLPNITYFNDGNGVIVSPLIDAMNAIYAGTCDTALVYHYNFRSPFNSKQAAADPYRRWVRGFDNLPPENARNAAAYAAWSSRYIHDYAVTRDQLARVAVNSRTNAIDNPLAGIRTPLTIEEYLQGRMVRDPLGMFDMDLPVDGADAFILTTAERARDLRQPAVLIHTAVQGLCETANDEEQLVSLGHHGQDVVVKQLWERSDRTLSDADLLYIYDGFTFIALSWLEKLGMCGTGEAGDFITQHWNKERNRVEIDGRLPFNLQGGMLSEGGSQGAGFVRDATARLRAGEGKTALLAVGGFFYNAQGMVLTNG